MCTAAAPEVLALLLGVAPLPKPAACPSLEAVAAYEAEALEVARLQERAIARAARVAAQAAGTMLPGCRIAA